MASTYKPVVNTFLAATKQLLEHLFQSVCLSACLSHLFHYDHVIISSWNQDLLPLTKGTSVQKVKVTGQR